MPPPDFLDQAGLRVSVMAMDAGAFVRQQVSPIFFKTTLEAAPPQAFQEVFSEQEFWEKSGRLLLGTVRLRNFRLSDWFPRAPGVHWSRSGFEVRQELGRYPIEHDPELGGFYSPEIKMALIERGGIGTIRLRPRKIDGVDCWLATAGTGTHCHSGVPLAVPDAVLRQSGVEWGDMADVTGRVRFIQDAGLDDIAQAVHGTRPVIVFVEELRGTQKRLQGQDHAIIAPVVLFDSAGPYGMPQYSFVQCADGSDQELDQAVEWFHLYSARYKGHIITNFDEQRPVLADAPLSYQKLVAKTYDRTVARNLSGTIIVERLDTLVHQETKVQIGGIHVGHNISVGGNAIVAIDSTLNNVTQTIGAAQGLDNNQKNHLEAMVQSLKTELDTIKASHPDEAKEIADAVQKAVSVASKPPEERKKSILQISAKGLTDAAELVKDLAPTVLTTAGMIAKFITGL